MDNFLTSSKKASLKMTEKKQPPNLGALKKFEPYFVYQGSTADEKGKTLTMKCTIPGCTHNKGKGILSASAESGSNLLKHLRSSHKPDS